LKRNNSRQRRRVSDRICGRIYCTASFNAELQKLPIKVIFPMLGEVCTLDELEIAS